MLKRTISLLLAASLAFTPVTCFAAGKSEDNNKSTQSAETLKALTLINGDTQGLRLNDQLSRAEALVLIVKLLGDQDKLEKANLSTFKDVNANDWFAPYVAYAKKHGIASGINQEQFAPNAKVNEKQFLKMILSAMDYEIGKDFSWETVESFAKSKGYAVSSNQNDNKNSEVAAFNRLNAFDFTFTALKLAPKNTEVTIFESLVMNGKIEKKLLEHPIVSQSVDKKLIETIQAKVAPKATNNTTPAVIPQVTPASPVSSGAPTPSGGGSFSGGSSGGGSNGSSNPTPPTPVNPPQPSVPDLPPQEVKITSVNSDYKSIYINFTEELDPITAELPNVVKLTGPNNTVLPIEAVKYYPGQKKLFVRYQNGKPGSTCVAEVDASKLKSATGKKVNMTISKNNFACISNEILYANNTDTSLNIYYNHQFKLENLKDLSQIKITNTQTGETINASKMTLKPESCQIQLDTNALPKSVPFKVSLKNIKLSSAYETYSDYEVTYTSNTLLEPGIIHTKFDKDGYLVVDFNESIKQDDLSDLKNYKLFKGPISWKNQLNIKAIKVIHDRAVALSIEGLTSAKDADYFLVVENITTTNNIKTSKPIVYTIKGTTPVIEPSKKVGLKTILAGLNYVDVYFKDAIDPSSFDDPAVVNIICLNNNDFRASIAPKSLSYSSAEKKLRINYEGIPSSKTCKLEFSPKYLKTADGQPTAVNDELSGYFLPISELSSIDNTKDRLIISFNQGFDFSSLKSTNQIKVSYEYFDYPISIKQIVTYPESNSIHLLIDDIPKNAPLKIIFNDIAFTYKGNEYKNYKLSYLTKTMAVPSVIGTQYENAKKLTVNFNEIIEPSDLKNMDNYKLYKNSTSPENAVPIRFIENNFSSYKQVTLYIDGLETDGKYVLTMNNMTSVDKIEANKTIIHEFRGPLIYSGIRLSSQVVNRNNEVCLLFTGDLDINSALNLDSYHLESRKDTSVTHKPNAARYDAVNHMVCLTFKDNPHLDDQAYYLSITYNAIKDRDGKTLKHNTARYGVGKPNDLQPLGLYTPQVTSPSAVQFYINWNLDKVTALNKKNYNITNEQGVSQPISSVVYDHKKSYATIELEKPFIANTNYQITMTSQSAITLDTQTQPVTVSFTGKDMDDVPPTIKSSWFDVNQSAIYFECSEDLSEACIRTTLKNMATYTFSGRPKYFYNGQVNREQSRVELYDILLEVNYVPETKIVKLSIDPSKIQHLESINYFVFGLEDLHQNKSNSTYGECTLND